MYWPTACSRPCGSESDRWAGRSQRVARFIYTSRDEREGRVNIAEPSREPLRDARRTTGRRAVPSRSPTLQLARRDQSGWKTGRSQSGDAPTRRRSARKLQALREIPRETTRREWMVYFRSVPDPWEGCGSAEMGNAPFILSTSSSLAWWW